jgi:hypothetical protein
MNFKHFFLLSSALAVISCCLSCKKDSSKPAPTTVEYQITPMNNFFTKITYTDSTGNAVVIDDPANFASGSKIITVTKKPFAASLETTLYNTTNTSINYNLVIKVNGEVKSYRQAVAAPMGTFTESTDFTVQ